MKARQVCCSPPPPCPAFVGEVASRYVSPFTSGEDGMMWTLPASTATITNRDLR